ncbi:LLM class flavin-dependent oxidoreductase [Cellulosimicrobium marinum]|uniref:LLM class flavin-dependent oxidoreductase n=1 Tax=Cellulosimicrobium marinum TaxID=1638992 RepID=UPI001E331777|nr:LLM class flavin-dependent oxidoreductase [Cellulosimicrobium marinum]MCB7135705.1 LLM class flavin-dependent oxidoreductase [Cellulosimicrobium marinum]
MVTIGVKTPQENLRFSELRDMWIAAEQIPRVEHLWLYDHFVAQGGSEHGAVPCLDAWASLAALAAATRRATLGILVSSVTYRSTAVLAAMSATVNEIAGGRLDLGLGVGWSVPEHEAWGIDFPAAGDRLVMLDETCAALRLLFAGGPVTFEGRHVRLDGAQVRGDVAPAPRLVLGGAGPRMLGVIARHADVWNVAGAHLPRLRATREDLLARCEALGRSAAEITVSAQVHAAVDAPDVTAAWCGRAVRSGAEHLVLELDRAATGREMERLVEAVCRVLDDTAPAAVHAPGRPVGDHLRRGAVRARPALGPSEGEHGDG